MKQRSDFTDDCGIWDTNKYSFHSVHSVDLATLNHVLKKGDAYYQKRVDKYRPIDPKPTAIETVTIRRLYSTLKRDKTYRRRIT